MLSAYVEQPGMVGTHNISSA